MPFKYRYSLEDYYQAMELHKKGYGSLIISKILKYPTRSAIENWINKSRKPYYFSEKRIAACNSKENVERMRAMNKLTQPKASRIAAELIIKRLPESSKILTEDLGYILGVVYGDGHVSVKQRRVMLGVTDKEFAEKFKETIERWSGFKARFLTKIQKPDIYIKSRKLIYLTYIDSKEAAIFLKNFDRNILLDSTTKIKSAFLRGFFDSEGHVSNYPISKSRVIKGFNTNYDLIILVQNLLISLSIYPTIYTTKTCGIKSGDIGKPYYVLSICKKESIINFYSLIGFNINRKQERLIRQVDHINMVGGNKNDTGRKIWE